MLRTQHSSELSDLENDDNKIVAWTGFESVMGQLEDAVLALTQALNETEDLANTINFHGDQGYVIESYPINVGKLIHDNILKLDANPFRQC